MINITQKEIIKKINNIKILKHIFIIDTDNNFTYDMFNNNENIFIVKTISVNLIKEWCYSYFNILKILSKEKLFNQTVFMLIINCKKYNKFDLNIFELINNIGSKVYIIGE